MDTTFTFKLNRFNPRRAMRGAPAAELVVSCEGQEDDVLWMDERDIKRNIAEFGPHPGLLEAKEAYRTRKEFPPGESP